jgi:arsenate reductase-like glutaredoxin family protein
MSEQPYKVQGSRVYGEGQSYNCVNIVTAEQLCSTLNKYYSTKELINNTSTQYDKLNKQLIQINMTLKVLEDEINTLSELVKQ